METNQTLDAFKKALEIFEKATRELNSTYYMAGYDRKYENKDLWLLVKEAEALPGKIVEKLAEFEFNEGEPEVKSFIIKCKKHCPGYEVVIASTVEEAKEKIKQFNGCNLEGSILEEYTDIKALTYQTEFESNESN